MKIIIQDTWEEDDDLELLEYIKENSISFTRLNRLELQKLSSVRDTLLFVDTDIIQQLTNFTIPTYPDCFINFYKRVIIETNYSGSQHYTLPFFIKPASNNKQFNALIVKDQYDAAYIDVYIGEQVYICEVVTFLNEFRLFICNNNVQGIVESTEFIFKDTPNTNSTVPPEFIDKVLQANIYPACVIDIGQLTSGDWVIVEVNPPHSLTSYGWPIELYFNYCKNVWKYISKQFN